MLWNKIDELLSQKSQENKNEKIEKIVVKKIISRKGDLHPDDLFTYWLIKFFSAILEKKYRGISTAEIIFIDSNFLPENIKNAVLIGLGGEKNNSFNEHIVSFSSDREENKSSSSKLLEELIKLAPQLKDEKLKRIADKFRIHDCYGNGVESYNLLFFFTEIAKKYKSSPMKLLEISDLILSSIYKVDLEIGKNERIEVATFIENWMKRKKPDKRYIESLKSYLNLLTLSHQQRELDFIDVLVKSKKLYGKKGEILSRLLLNVAYEIQKSFFEEAIKDAKNKSITRLRKVKAFSGNNFLVALTESGHEEAGKAIRYYFPEVNIIVQKRNKQIIIFTNRKKPIPKTLLRCIIKTIRILECVFRKRKITEKIKAKIDYGGVLFEIPEWYFQIEKTGGKIINTVNNSTKIPFILIEKLIVAILKFERKFNPELFIATTLKILRKSKF